MSIRNFCETSYDTAINMLGEGYVICESKGQLVAAFEIINHAYNFATSEPVNVHFPNGQYLSEKDMWTVGLNGFNDVARRVDYLSIAEMSDTREIDAIGGVGEIWDRRR